MQNTEYKNFDKNYQTRKSCLNINLLYFFATKLQYNSVVFLILLNEEFIKIGWRVKL